DKRFERSVEYYPSAGGHSARSALNGPIASVESEYNLGKDDEMITPAYNRNNPLGGILPFDAVIFTNFRPDRAIQIA
ncbi:2,3-bisphosphoglycerate-independent phosphoglycerate mutase, partial [Rhizobium sp. KAs_5_22]